MATERLFLWGHQCYETFAGRLWDAGFVSPRLVWPQRSILIHLDPGSRGSPGIPQDPHPDPVEVGAHEPWCPSASPLVVHWTEAIWNHGRWAIDKCGSWTARIGGTWFCENYIVWYYMNIWLCIYIYIRYIYIYISTVIIYIHLLNYICFVLMNHLRELVNECEGDHPKNMQSSWNIWLQNEHLASCSLR